MSVLQDVIQCNVFRLGKVYSNVAKSLGVVFDLVDPSIFVDRIVAGLKLAGHPLLTQQQSDAKNKELGNKIRDQALQVLSMAKKDWLLVGRVPSAASAAAVVIALRSQGIEYPTDDIANDLHIAPRWGATTNCFSFFSVPYSCHVSTWLMGCWLQNCSSS